MQKLVFKFAAPDATENTPQGVKAAQCVPVTVDDLLAAQMRMFEDHIGFPIMVQIMINNPALFQDALSSGVAG